MFKFQCCASFSKTTSSVLLQIPLCRADVRQEIFYFGVMLEQFAIEMAWVPIDQHTTEIEDDYRAIGLAHDCPDKNAPDAKCAGRVSTGMDSPGKVRARVGANLVGGSVAIGGADTSCQSSVIEKAPLPPNKIWFSLFDTSASAGVIWG